ncbi:MAG: hypothetical protein LBU65_03915 [Planctomycetaceae bacterium]|jgi:hypothetical protein|nr:hypothetical protein [Planctomycetaceae bacterium]
MGKFYLFFARLFVVFTCTLGIALIWVPDKVSYVVANDVTIQTSECHGFEALYYSRFKFLPEFLPKPEIITQPYARRMEALYGEKSLGFTPVRSGCVGKTILNPTGFIVLLIPSMFLIYFTIVIYNLLPNLRIKIVKTSTDDVITPKF